MLQIGEKEFTLEELKELLVFSDKDVLIYNITPLFNDKDFKELLTIYINNLPPELQVYDFGYAYEIGEYLSANIQDIIVKIND